MAAHEIVAECERVGPGTGTISSSILPEGAPAPVPKKRHELPVVPPEQMLPPTPCVHVKTKQDAFSPAAGLVPATADHSDPRAGAGL